MGKLTLVLQDHLFNQKEVRKIVANFIYNEPGLDLKVSCCSGADASFSFFLPAQAFELKEK